MTKGILVMTKGILKSQIIDVSDWVRRPHGEVIEEGSLYTSGPPEFAANYARIEIADGEFPSNGNIWTPPTDADRESEPWEKIPNCADAHEDRTPCLLRVDDRLGFWYRDGTKVFISLYSDPWAGVYVCRTEQVTSVEPVRLLADDEIAVKHSVAQGFLNDYRYDNFSKPGMSLIQALVTALDEQESGDDE